MENNSVELLEEKALCSELEQKATIGDLPSGDLPSGDAAAPAVAAAQRRTCPWGRGCKHLAVRKCKNFHPNSEIKCWHGAKCKYLNAKEPVMKDGKKQKCEYFHPAAEIPCIFGKKCKNGTQCKFAHSE
jgi:hypothetical protein